MATVIPPPSKRQKVQHLERTRVQQDPSSIPQATSIWARFVDDENNQITDLTEISSGDVSEKKLSLLVNTVLERESDDFIPYCFSARINDDEVIDLLDTPASLSKLLQNSETSITIIARPQAVFRVQAVSRLLHRIPGHAQPILTVQWSPNSELLATGSGDNTVRIWDTDTGTPLCTMKGHSGWVLDVRWSPDGEQIASCSMDNSVRRWDPRSGKVLGQVLSGHKRWVSSIAWQPYHLWGAGEGPRLASASKDGTVRLWVVNTGRTESVLSCRDGVSCVKWGGTNLVYTASRDKSVRVWDAKAGTLIHDMTAHAHVVNHLALSTDFVLRTGYFEKGKDIPNTEDGKRALAKERFEKAARKDGKVNEILVSASDDCTIYLWDPANLGKKFKARLFGHQKPINFVAFSPDQSVIVSTGWDNISRLWDARDGKFLHALRGHVGPVYQCAFSADSRLLVTGSKDCTLKVWDVRTGKLVRDLPGHQDEVYAVDWAPVRGIVGSGGKDKAVRIWSS